MIPGAGHLADDKRAAQPSRQQPGDRRAVQARSGRQREHRRRRFCAPSRAWKASGAGATAECGQAAVQQEGCASRARSRRRGSTRCTAAPAWMPSWRRFAISHQAHVLTLASRQAFIRWAVDRRVLQRREADDHGQPGGESRRGRGAGDRALATGDRHPLTVGRTARLLCTARGTWALVCLASRGRADQKGPRRLRAQARQAGLDDRRGQRLFDGPASRQT